MMRFYKSNSGLEFAGERYLNVSADAGESAEPGVGFASLRQPAPSFPILAPVWIELSQINRCTTVIDQIVDDTGGSGGKLNPAAKMTGGNQYVV